MPIDWRIPLAYMEARSKTKIGTIIDNQYKIQYRDIIFKWNNENSRYRAVWNGVNDLK